jgi:hypothetical protein
MIIAGFLCYHEIIGPAFSAVRYNDKNSAPPAIKKFGKDSGDGIIGRHKILTANWTIQLAVKEENR